MAEDSSGSRRLALHFLGVRRAIGFVGLALPLVLLVGGWLVFGMALEPTISDYHGTPMRDVFVGMLCAIGVFLWAYRGYGAEDLFASQFAGTFALVVALFPNVGATSTVHFAAAALFFVTLALMSIFLFTKSKDPKGQRPAGKRHRNAVYVACGVGIFACLAAIVVYKVWLEAAVDGLAAIGPVFWLESLAVWFFAASWIVKGEALQGTLVPDRVQRFFQAEDTDASST